MSLPPTQQVVTQKGEQSSSPHFLGFFADLEPFRPPKAPTRFFHAEGSVFICMSLPNIIYSPTIKNPMNLKQNEAQTTT